MPCCDLNLRIDLSVVTKIKMHWFQVADVSTCFAEGWFMRRVNKGLQFLGINCVARIVFQQIVGYFVDCDYVSHETKGPANVNTITEAGRRELRFTFRCSCWAEEV